MAAEDKSEMNGNIESITDLLKETIRDTQALIRGEVALAKAELREEAQRLGGGAAMLAGAAVAALLGATFLLTAAAWGVVALMNWPAWTGFAAVGVLLVLAAAVFASIGRRRLSGARPMARTMDTMKENLRWLRARTS